jgi:hypothetical protein
MRVDVHQSPVCLEVCGAQARERGRFAGPRFPKNPEMAKTVGLRDAEGMGVAVMVSLAKDGQVLYGGRQMRGGSILRQGWEADQRGILMVW